MAVGISDEHEADLINARAALHAQIAEIDRRQRTRDERYRQSTDHFLSLLAVCEPELFAKYSSETEYGRKWDIALLEAHDDAP
jgi:hypothetical protein